MGGRTGILIAVAIIAALSIFFVLTLQSAPAGFFGVGQGTQIILGNSRVSFVFETGSNNALFLERIRNLQIGRDFPTDHAELLAFSLRDSSGAKNNYRISDLPSTFSWVIDTLPGEQVLHLDWTGVQVDTGNSLSISADVNLQDTADIADFRVNVTTATPDYSLYNITFPQADFLGFSATDTEAFVVPSRMGFLVLDPRTNYRGVVASVPGTQLQGSQFLAYYDMATRDMLFFGTRDPDYYYKFHVFNITADTVGFANVHVPENHLTPDIDYSAPYPVALGTFVGDWYDAAQFYRPWSVQTFAPRGKLETTGGISSIFRSLDFQFTVNVTNSNAQNTMNELNNFKQFFNRCPDPDMPGYACDPTYQMNTTLIDMFEWHANGFHQGWPMGYKPMRSQVFDIVNQSHEQGDYVIPYTYHEIYYIDSPGYGQTVLDNSLVNESGDVVVNANIFSGVDHVFPDPSTSWYQQLVKNIMVDIIDFGDDDPAYAGVGFDGAYWDVWSGDPPYLDYAATHGHPQGGGDYWTQGEWAKAQATRTALSPLKPEWLMESEHPAEPFINDLEFVQWNSPPPWTDPTYNIPLYPALYHDYISAVSIVSTVPNINIKAQGFGIPLNWYNYIWATYFSFGLFPSVGGKDLDFDSAFPIPAGDIPYYTFLKELFRSQSYAKKFMRYGQMLRPPDTTGNAVDPTSFAVPLPAVFYPNYYPDVPYVMPSAWNASDGSAGIILVNWWNQPEQVALNINLQDYGFSSGTVYLSQLGETARTLQGVYTNDFTYSLTVPEGLTVLELSQNDVYPPSAPGGPVPVVQGSSQIDLSWAAATDETGIGGYRVDVATDSGFANGVPGWNLKDVGAVLSTSVTGLSPSTTYYIRVLAYDTAGNQGPFSNPVQTATNAPPADDYPAVLLLTPGGYATVPPGNVIFTFSATDDNGLFNGTLYTNLTGSMQPYLGYVASLTGTAVTSSITLPAVAANHLLWNVEVCDVSGHCSFASTNFTLYVQNNIVTADNPPIVMLLTPPDNTVLSTGTIVFNATITDDNQLFNATLYHNMSGTLAENQTISLAGLHAEAVFTLAAVPNETHLLWNIQSCDTAGQCAVAGTSFSLMVLLTCTDADGDGYSPEQGCSVAADCNDQDAGTYPGAPETCGDGVDQDCSGADTVCPPSGGGSGGGGSGGGGSGGGGGPPPSVCQSGDTQSCSTGLQGECGRGIQTCSSGNWGSCVQVASPLDEVCDGLDNNCNGIVDEEVCECTRGDVKPCGSSVGVCEEGVSTCVRGAWGPCEGGVAPQLNDTCGDNLDNNCDGNVDEGCPEPQCANGVQDGRETGVDCGGSCPADCPQFPVGVFIAVGSIVLVVLLLLRFLTVKIL